MDTIYVTATHPELSHLSCADEPFLVGMEGNNVYIMGKWGCSTLYPNIPAAVRDMARRHGCVNVSWRQDI